MMHLTLAVVLATVMMLADLSPEELVARLDSPDHVVREEAARTLEERGADARAVLRVASRKADAPEARARVADLLDRVESRLLDRPTMVALDFDDRPLGEAVKALAARSGFSVVLDDPALAGRRVSCHAPDPLAFWEALDRLGRAAHVRHDPSPRPANGEDAGASLIRLIDGDPPAHTAYSGPLRIHLYATHRDRGLSFQADANRPVPAPRATSSVTAEVQAFAEPGRFIDPDGTPRLEVIDGPARASAPLQGGSRRLPSEHSWLVPGRLSLLHWHVPLGLPDPTAPALLKLRGVLPVVISARRPDPLVIPLEGAAGKTFRGNGIVVRVDNVETLQGGNPSVNLTLIAGDDPPEPFRGLTGPQADRVTDFVANRLEFQDAGGLPLLWHLGVPRPGQGKEQHVNTMIAPRAPVVRLLVYRLRRLSVEVPFELGDVPAP